MATATAPCPVSTCMSMCEKVVTLCNKACSHNMIRRTAGCYDCLYRCEMLCKGYMELVKCGLTQKKESFSYACCKELCCICCCLETICAMEMGGCLAQCQNNSACKELMPMMEPFMASCRETCVTICKMSGQCCTSICATPICGDVTVCPITGEPMPMVAPDAATPCSSSIAPKSTGQCPVSTCMTMCEKVVALCNKACVHGTVRGTAGCYDCLCRCEVLCKGYMELVKCGLTQKKESFSYACCKELCCICCCLETICAMEMGGCLAQCQNNSACKELMPMMEPFMASCRETCVTICKMSGQCCTSICATPICGNVTVCPITGEQMPMAAPVAAAPCSSSIVAPKSTPCAPAAAPTPAPVSTQTVDSGGGCCIMS